jgi:hypothetical protein
MCCNFSRLTYNVLMDMYKRRFILVGARANLLLFTHTVANLICAHANLKVGI